MKRLFLLILVVSLFSCKSKDGAFVNHYLDMQIEQDKWLNTFNRMRWRHEDSLQKANDERLYPYTQKYKLYQDSITYFNLKFSCYDNKDNQVGMSWALKKIRRYNDLASLLNKVIQGNISIDQYNKWSKCNCK